MASVLSLSLIASPSTSNTPTGTWRSPVGEVEAAVYHAIVHAGYRHIDCAFAYGNEAEVGSALKRIFAEGHVTRSDLFITSKLWSTYHTRAAEGIQKSLDLLGLDYLDLYLIHWPIPLNAHGNSDLFPTLPDGSRDIDTNWTFNQTWASLEDLHKAGKARAIGVSNFSVPYLQRLLEGAKVVPAVNQIENHPLLLQTKLVEFCQSKGIVVTAYSPFGSIGGPLLANPVLKGIAEKNGVSVGNVILNSLCRFTQLSFGTGVIANVGAGE